jgi:protein TonB
MKLDILKNQWLDIVFEGNKTGAYELRKSKKTTKSAYSRAIFFSIALAAPLIIDLLPKGAEEDMDRDIKITVSYPKEEGKIKCSTTPTTTKSGSG